MSLAAVAGVCPNGLAIVALCVMIRRIIKYSPSSTSERPISLSGILTLFSTFLKYSKYGAWVYGYSSAQYIGFFSGGI